VAENARSVVATVTLALLLLHACGSPDATGGGPADSSDPPDAALPQDAGAPDAGAADAADAAVLPDRPDPSDDAQPQDAGAPDAGGLFVGTGDPYEKGPLSVKTVDVAEGQDGAPASFQTHAPVPAGRYAVIVFQHGFLLANKFYSDMLLHVASHGFVVVAPQMYNADGIPIGKPKVPEEAALAVELYDWLPAHVGALPGVDAETAALGLAGHSRGGKVIWTVLKGDSTRAKAVAGVDPVDGTGGPLGGEERVIEGTFGLPFPSYVLGTGLGPTGAQPCAPAGDNHEQFYGASASPAWHVVATEYGHNDMLNDTVTGCGMVCTVCPKGPDKASMRKLTAGQLVAFFRGSLQGDPAAYAWLTDTAKAPVKMTAESK